MRSPSALRLGERPVSPRFFPVILMEAQTRPRYICYNRIYRTLIQDEILISWRRSPNWGIICVHCAPSWQVCVNL